MSAYRHQIVDNATRHEQQDMRYCLRDNAIVVALLMWRCERDGNVGYDINADKSYLEIQRERVFLATELGTEIIKVLELEKIGKHPEVMHEPKGYVWAGTYYAKRSNRPERCIGYLGEEKAAASNKRPRTMDQRR